MSSFIIKTWYQLDFQISNPAEDLMKINSIMDNLKGQEIISRWFFLFEGETIRVRMQSKNKGILQENITELSEKYILAIDNEYPFSEYTESSDLLFNEETAKIFANIMSEVTQFTIGKLKKEIQFDNYRIMERINHCIFNNMAVSSGQSEEYLLIQRLSERLGMKFDSDFENQV